MLKATAAAALKQLHLHAECRVQLTAKAAKDLSQAQLCTAIAGIQVDTVAPDCFNDRVPRSCSSGWRSKWSCKGLVDPHRHQCSLAAAGRAVHMPRSSCNNLSLGRAEEEYTGEQEEYAGSPSMKFQSVLQKVLSWAQLWVTAKSLIASTACLQPSVETA